MTNRFKRFNSIFTFKELETKLAGLDSASAYSFTKKYNPKEFNNLLTFLPNGYTCSLNDNIESIDFIYSGSSQSHFQLTFAVVRNDTYQGKEVFDIDVFNISPETENTESYFRQQWHHYKDLNGNRASIELSPFLMSDKVKKKDLTYGTYLTGSVVYSSIDEYEKQKPYYYKIHKNSFEDLNK